MAIVQWEKEGSVAVLYMNNGDNRQNPLFFEAMIGALDEIENDGSVSAVVISSTHEKTWSVGVDIEWLGQRAAEEGMKEIKGFLLSMNDLFRKLLLYPMPVIAALNGHAFGNGAILSCACDFRFMKSDRGYFCFPEVDLGIPFLPGMIAFVRKAVPEWKFNELALTGKRAGAVELAEHHVIEKACDSEAELMAEAKAFAAGLVKRRGIFGELKKRMHADIIRVMDNEDPAVIESGPLMIQD